MEVKDFMWLLVWNCCVVVAVVVVRPADVCWNELAEGRGLLFDWFFSGVVMVGGIMVCGIVGVVEVLVEREDVVYFEVVFPSVGPQFACRWCCPKVVLAGWWRSLSLAPDVEVIVDGCWV